MAIEIYSKYQPNEWQKKMHSCQETHLCTAGAKGSGKSRAALEELKMCALEHPGTTWLIGRKTLPSLKDSTWKEFLLTLDENLIKYQNKNDRLVQLINGSTFIGRPLDDPKKFDSMQISGFMIDEADEIEKDIYDTLKSRVREMPGGRIPRYRTFLVLNPCEEDHWIPQMFLHEKPYDHAMYQSSTFDNMANLPPDYIKTLMATYTPDMQQRMLHGMFGKVHKGRPVYPQFSRGEYIRTIEPVQKYPIYRCLDFGFNRPAITWIQFVDGQLRILAEKLGHRIYLDDFLKDHVFPFEKELWGIWPKYLAICDPRGSDESDKGQSSIDILNDFGIYPLHRRTRIQEGIKAIKHLLDTKNNEGEPNLLVHPRCKNFIEGARGGYHRIDGSEEPEKDGFYEHVQDTVRYGAVMLLRRHKLNAASALLDNRNVIISPHTGRRIEL